MLKPEKSNTISYYHYHGHNNNRQINDYPRTNNCRRWNRVCRICHRHLTIKSDTLGVVKTIYTNTIVTIAANRSNNQRTSAPMLFSGSSSQTVSLMMLAL